MYVLFYSHEAMFWKILINLYLLFAAFHAFFFLNFFSKNVFV